MFRIHVQVIRIRTQSSRYNRYLSVLMSAELLCTSRDRENQSTKIRACAFAIPAGYNSQISTPRLLRGHARGARHAYKPPLNRPQRDVEIYDDMTLGLANNFDSRIFPSIRMLRSRTSACLVEIQFNTSQIH